MDHDVQDTLEDVGIGAANVLGWVSDHGSGILITTLSAIYIIYKIIREKAAGEKERHERDLAKDQLNRWREITEEAESKLKN